MNFTARHRRARQRPAEGEHRQPALAQPLHASEGAHRIARREHHAVDRVLEGRRTQQLGGLALEQAVGDLDHDNVNMLRGELRKQTLHHIVQGVEVEQISRGMAGIGEVEHRHCACIAE